MRFRRAQLLASLRKLHRPRREGTFFAWLPRRLDNGTWVWLETYTRAKKYHLKLREDRSTGTTSAQGNQP